MDTSISKSLENSIDTEVEDINEKDVHLILNGTLDNEFLLQKIQNSKFPLVRVEKFDIHEYNLKYSSFRVTKYLQTVIDSIFLSTHYSKYINEKIDIQHLGSRKGYGVIAIDNIPANEVISLYFGIVTFKRPRTRGDRVIEVADRDKIYWIDGKRDEESYSAFYNDNHINPNLEIRYLKPSVSEYKYPFFVTSRKILKDEELTYRYPGNSEDYWWRTSGKKYKSLKYDLRKPKSLCSGKSLQKIFEYHVDNGISEDKSSFEIVDCNEKGKGVIAKRQFPKDSFLMFYSGQEVDEKELIDDSYVYEIHINNKRKWVNAFYSKCYSRYLNDNNESPNVYVKPMKHPRNGKTYIVFLAKTDIEPGDQLEYDYGGGSRNYDWRKKPKLSENPQITLEGDVSEDVEDMNQEHSSESEYDGSSISDKSHIQDISEFLPNAQQDFQFKVLNNFKDTLLSLHKLRKSNELVEGVSFKSLGHLLEGNGVELKENCLLLELWSDCRSLYEQYLQMQNVFYKIPHSSKIDWLPTTDSSLLINDNLYSCLDAVESALKKQDKFVVNAFSYEHKINELFEFVFKLIKEPTNYIQEPMSSVQEPLSSIQESTSSIQESTSSIQEPTIQEPTNSIQEPTSSLQDPTDSNQETTSSVKEFSNLGQTPKNFCQKVFYAQEQDTISGEETAINHMEGLNAGLDSKSMDQDPTNCTQKGSLNTGHDRNNFVKENAHSCKTDIKIIQEIITLDQEENNEDQNLTTSSKDNINKNLTTSGKSCTNFFKDDFNTSQKHFDCIQERVNTVNESKYVNKDKNLMIKCLKEKMIQEQCEESTPIKILKTSKYNGKNNSNANTCIRLKNIHQFNKCFEEVESWLLEMEQTLEVDNYGADLNDVQKQLKKLAHFDAALLSYQDNIDGFRLFTKLLKESTVIELNIRDKQKVLEERYNALRGKALIRKKSLERAYQVFRLLRDIEELDAWVQEREPFSRITSWGRDLTGVQTLIGKHQSVLNEIEQHEDKLTIIRSAAVQNPFIKNKVHSKLCNLNKNWELLISNCERRKRQLNYSHQIHQFFSSATEFESWMDETEKIPKSTRNSDDTKAKLRMLLKTMDCYADAIVFASKKKELESVNVCQGFVLTPVKENIENMAQVTDFTNREDLVVVKRKLKMLKNRYDKFMERS